MVNAVLLDARNWSQEAPVLLDKIQKCKTVIGFDIETHDANAHAGIKQFRGNDSARVFDTERTTVTGCSFYVDDDDTAYYCNLAHADVQNRVPWENVRQLLDAKPAGVNWVAHKAPFEITMMRKSLGYELKDVICSMQLCASAYGPDEYDIPSYQMQGLAPFRPLLASIAKEFADYDPSSNADMTAAQGELFGQILGKQSSAAWSYNGLVSNVAYGYSLKKAVERWFGVKMRTFKETIGKKEHMGQLTGEEVVAYGADDAYWAVRLYYRVLEFMLETNPDAIACYIEQELPMVPVYADIWGTGMVVNTKAIDERRDLERAECAKILREMKPAVKSLLPFPQEPHQELAAADDWYAKNWKSYRSRIVEWANKPDSADDFIQCAQISGSVSKPWAEELKKPKPTGPNFTHYMMIRTLMYDLLGEKLIKSEGKTQSDGEARGRMLERLKKKEAPEAKSKVLTSINALAGVEQRMKLYLNPYVLLRDPETGRMYPEVSSILATHRMACQNPNAQQLAKRGSSTYVRGFYEADDDDEVLVSADWSQIELVLIGELSGDPEFAKAYGQLPYDDLHIGATADCLSVVIPEVTTELISKLGKMSAEEINAINPKILIKPSGEVMEPGDAKKYWRTEVGKGANFNYWYSGALSTVGEKLGWTSDQMWEATERYRQRFAVAEEWRLNTISQARECGFVKKPDGLRRVRFEATYAWQNLWASWWEAYNDPGLRNFGRLSMKKITNRAGNQLINALIQGSCATLAKRSIVRSINMIAEKGYKARFKLPVHDELVYSVRRSEVLPFIKDLRAIMNNHPDIISKLKVHCTVSVGRTFEPYNAKKAPFGQIELDEAPDGLGIGTPGAVMNDNEIEQVLEYLKEAA